MLQDGATMWHLSFTAGQITTLIYSLVKKPVSNGTTSAVTRIDEKHVFLIHVYVSYLCSHLLFHLFLNNSGQ